MFPRTTPGAGLRQQITLLGIADAELVARFAATRDDDAFAELVRRHGPMVLAVCRRVTGNRHDADDAFQAAFLVLARKPERVRPGAPLAGWLYGVAVRAACKAAARSARRRAQETAVAEVPDVPAGSSVPDLETTRAVLEEVARLSAPYRAAVVLCELEGRSRAAAARELGIAEGTLSSRLAAARKALARRFRDRGLAPAVLAAVAGAATCPVLAADAALLRRAAPAPHVLRLSEVVMNTGFPSGLAVAALVIVSLGLALGSTGADTAPPTGAARPAPKVAEAPANEKAKPNAQPPSVPNRVGRIIIEGNDDIPDELILRRLGMAPGDVLRYPNIEKARASLARFGFCADEPPSVEVVPSHLGDTAFKDIRVRVRARPWDWGVFTRGAVAAFVTLDVDRIWAAGYRLRSKVAEAWPAGKPGQK